MHDLRLCQSRLNRWKTESSIEKYTFKYIKLKKIIIFQFIKFKNELLNQKFWFNKIYGMNWMKKNCLNILINDKEIIMEFHWKIFRHIHNWSNYLNEINFQCLCKVNSKLRVIQVSWRCGVNKKNKQAVCWRCVRVYTCVSLICSYCYGNLCVITFVGCHARRRWGLWERKAFTNTKRNRTTQVKDKTHILRRAFCRKASTQFLTLDITGTPNPRLSTRICSLYHNGKQSRVHSVKTSALNILIGGQPRRHKNGR